jgi:hypothetical protein
VPKEEDDAEDEEQEDPGRYRILSPEWAARAENASFAGQSGLFLTPIIENYD